MLIVGTGQSGGQIAEELHAAGRSPPSVSIVPEAPRRYRGQDLIYWMLETGKHGPEFDVNALTREALPSPAARFAPNPTALGYRRRSRHPPPRTRPSRHAPARPPGINRRRRNHLQRGPPRPPRSRSRSIFAQATGKAIDAYISAAGIDAPEQEPLPAGRLAAFRAGSVEPGRCEHHIRHVGQRVQTRLPVSQHALTDHWDYPRHDRGVTEFPGIYVVELPCSHRYYSTIIGAVGWTQSTWQAMLPSPDDVTLNA